MNRKDKGVGADQQGRESYYAEAGSWARDRDDARRNSARTAWIVAGVALGLSALEALALIGMMPLKTVVPYTLLVDRNTGYVQALEGVHPQAISADSTLRQALLAQYVIAREGYDATTISDQYRKVSLWSANGARAEYLAQMQTGNAASPINRYGRAQKVAVRVESVSPLGDARAQEGRALVRFVSTVQDARGNGPGNGGGAPGQPAYWVAVLQYRFVGNPASLEDRLTNPLGFQVVAYRRDQEAPPVAGPVAVAAQPALTPMSAAMASAAAAQPLALPAHTVAPSTREPTPRPNPAPPPGSVPLISRYAPWRIPQPAATPGPAAGQAASQITGGEP